MATPGWPAVGLRDALRETRGGHRDPGAIPRTAPPLGELRSFTIELVGAPTATVLNEWSPGLEATDVGFLRCLRYRLEPPVVATGVRLTVHDAADVPVLYDLLAFGEP